MPLLTKELMWTMPPVISPDATLRDAARKMIEVDAGVLPVGSDGKIEGIITDRDIVVRAVSKGKEPEREIVSDFMTPEIHTCKENDSIGEAAKLMKEKNVSRLVVVNDQNNFSGILSFGHILRDDANAEEATDMVTKVAQRKNGKDDKSNGLNKSIN